MAAEESKEHAEGLSCEALITSNPSADRPDESSPFTYDTLDDPNQKIRLAIIHPGDWQAEIDCTLHTVSLESQPVYKALSYVWGDSEECKNIRLNRRDFAVTMNLYKALRRIRQEHEDLTIWIDAICINQNGDTEKSHQVALMKTIYSNCEEALLFLQEISVCDDWDSKTPPTSRAAKAAFELLDIFAQGKHFDELPCFVKDSDDRLFVSEQYDFHFQSIDYLSGLTWWTRIWTVQEAVLPSRATLVWASEQLPTESLFAAITSWHHHSANCCSSYYWSMRSTTIICMDDLQDSAWAIMNVRSEIRHQRCIGLPYARSFCAGKAASDPRDLCFAVLGLVNPWDADGPLIPDYSMPVRKALVASTMRILSTASWNFVGRRTVSRRVGLPTWIPDWAVSTIHINDLECDFRIEQSLFHSSGNSKWEFKFMDDSLLLKALRVDALKILGSFYESVDGNVYTLRRWMGMMTITELPQLSDIDDAVDSFWRTAIHDLHGIGYSQRRASVTDYREFSAALRALSTPLADIHDPILYANLVRSMDCSFGRRFFMTEGGTPGLGYPQAQAGDEVYVLLGCDVPYLLRRCEEKVSPEGIDGRLPSFQVIGNCYLHGIMDGEALEGNWEKRIETIVLV